MSPNSALQSPRLLEHERSFQLLFYRQPVPMYVFDRETLEILAVNNAAVEKYGWSREEFTGLSIADIRPPEELPEFQAYCDRTRDATSSELNDALTWRHLRKDATILELECTWVEVPWEERSALVVTCVDRSELKASEERAREQANLLDLAADAIIVRDLDTRVLFWNRGAERLYGWNAAEIIGKKVTELMVPDMHRFAAAEKELLEKGVWSGDFHHRRRDGREIVVISRWTLVRDEQGRPKSVLVINTDVTETKKLESQFLRAQRLEAIGTLASGIAHDLNNILSPILMSIGILRQTTHDEDGDGLLSIIESSAERGAGIVKQVLTFARGVEGERVLLQPRHLLSELAKIVAQTFPRNIDIQSHLSPELWMINGDATQLHQVLLNLCVNARDAMLQGGRLTISAENVEVDEYFASTNPGAQLGPHLAFRIADTGSGMSPETLEQIFDPFFTTKDVGKGTGLGLATVVGIVKSHCGFINVQSEVGIGTTFQVFIPAADDAFVDAPREESFAAARGNGELVLVVDDEFPIREALVRILQTNGYRAYTAEDGSDALALYFQRRDEINIVLTDISMGQMDGLTLVRSLRRLNPDVQIIVSSGHFQKENVSVFEGLGVKVFLEKPYTADKLLRALQAVRAAPVPSA